MRELILSYTKKLFRRLYHASFTPLPLAQVIEGNDNVLQDDGAHLEGVEVEVRGNRNQISIGHNCHLKNVRIQIKGDDHRLEIGQGVRFTRGGTIWFEDDHGELKIGAGTTVVEAHFAVTEARSRIIVGDDCMLANDIDIRTGDSHSVLEASTGKRMNYAKDVILEDHVWVGAHCRILKGVHLHRDTIVATAAVVIKSTSEPGVILAGVPAVERRKGVTWRRDRIAQTTYGE